MARSRYWRVLDALTDLGFSYREAQTGYPCVVAAWDAREWPLTVRGADGIAAHPVVAAQAVDECLEEEEAEVPAGRFVVVALSTKGGTYKRSEKRGKKRDRRPLYVKVLMRSRHPHDLHDFERALRRTTETGIIPDGYEIFFADWAKGRGIHANEGRITRALATELQSFYGALHHENTTIEVRLADKNDMGGV
jgi:hypothetical protein